MKFLIWRFGLVLGLAWLLPVVRLAGQPAQAQVNSAADLQAAAQDARRAQAIAEYTQKMKDANYPALFDKAAAEFNVPPDVLKAVSFAETRWTQLEWPAGETVSPDNGMPHAYGIMSLWDNDYFGHTLAQAAQLIGQDPEVLKTDVFQNMRGGAALLRQLYDQTPKPADAPSESQIESWREAIAKYTGIPQPQFSEAHALRVYEYMNAGYHQYGIEWDAHPVNLGPMREAVAKIVSAGTAPATNKVEEPKPAFQPRPAPSAAPAPQVQVEPKPVTPVVATNAVPAHGQDNAQNVKQRWLLGGLMVLLIVIAIWYLRSGKPRSRRGTR